MDEFNTSAKSHVKGRAPRRLWALILCLAMVVCVLAGCKKQDEALADTYRNAAQEAVDAGDLDAAIALLEEAVADTGLEDLEAMLEELKIQRLDNIAASYVPEPEPEPESEPEPEPEPEPELEAGDAVTVDGTLLSGSVIQDGILYVKQSEFEAVCEAEGDLPEALSLLTYHGEVYLPLEDVCAALGIPVYTDAEEAHLYCTTAAGSWTVAEGYQVPVLMYHGVTDDTWGSVELFVSPANLEEQLQYLTENGYDPIWFEDLRHIEDYDKPVLLTFDDGYRDNYAYLFPLLQKYQVKATIFVITNNLGRLEKFMTVEQVQEMAQSGLVSIQSHTVTHPYLNQISQEQLEQELTQSKLAITRMTGREPYVLCYPYGNFSQTVLEMTGEYYHFGITMNDGLYTTGSQAATNVPRYYVSRYTTLGEYKYMVQ